MTKEEMMRLSHNFCLNACGERKKQDCDSRMTTCVRLAEFLIKCKKEES